MIFVNFKSYQSGTGEKGFKIAEYCQKVSLKGEIKFIPVVQTVDIYQVSQELDDGVWVQNADDKKAFKNTGYITVYALKQAGAVGIFINHSDCPKKLSEIKNLISMSKKYGLKSLVFAKNSQEVKQFDKLKPDFVSLEDPKLIASKIAMVDKYEHELRKIIKNTKTPFVIGAGIRTKKHYQKALKLGAVGVVLSSQIMEADSPKRAIEDLF